MMQFPITRLKCMQSGLDKLLGLQAAQRAIRARPNYTIYENYQRAAYDAVPYHKAEMHAKWIR